MSYGKANCDVEKLVCMNGSKRIDITARVFY